MPMIRHSKRRGSVLLELALVASFVMIPLTLGVLSVGMTISRSIRVYELDRDAAHMFARGIDFSLTTSRALLVRMANGLNMTDSGGSGVVILTQIQCTAAGQAYCTRRFVIGNASLRSSSYANPTHIDASGNVDYTKDPAANANSFLNVLSMAVGDKAYVAETYFSASDYDLVGYITGSGSHATAIF